MRKQFVIDFAYYACWIILVYVGFKYALPLLVPFVFGYIFSALSRKLTKNKSNLVLIAVYLLLGVLVAVSIVSLVNTIQGLVSMAPTFYKNSIEPIINAVYEKLEDTNDMLNIPWIRQALDTALSLLKTGITSFSKWFLSSMSSMVFSIPSVLFSVLIFIVSSFYFTADFEVVDKFVNDNFPAVMNFISQKLSKVIWGYVKIIGITFVELSIGFLLLRVKSPILFALLVAFVDILPVLGTGTVLIPWGIALLILGDVKGLFVLVLYVVITVVRQYIEPKIVSYELELPAIVTLMSMVIGMRVFGLSGMIGLPLLASYYVYRNKEKTEV